MNRDDIIRMAREAGLQHYEAHGVPVVSIGDVAVCDLERFAAIVAAAERWEIKKYIEEEMTDELDDQAYHLCMELIAKILKRGNNG